MTDRQRKSDWTGMVVDSPRHQEAAKSWFAGLIRSEDVILSARVLTRISDDTPVKLQAVVAVAGSGTRRFTRTFGRNFSVSADPVERVPA